MPSSKEPILAHTATKPLEIFIAGASYAGLAATVNLLDLCAGQPCRFTRTAPASGSLTGGIPIHITLVDERDGYYHLIGQPLACASQSYAESSWTKFSDIAALQTPRVSCVQGKVIEVDCARKVARVAKHGATVEKQSEEYSYDYFIAASGLRREWPTSPRALVRTEYLSEIREQLKLIERCENGVVVIGGGAVGIEMAAELKLMKPECHVTLVHSRPQLLSNEDLPVEYKERALSMLEGSGVHTILGSRVDNISVPPSHESTSSQYNLTLSNGQILRAGQVINAVSHTLPTTSYLPDSALDNDGLVRITPQLNFLADALPNTEYHFAAGDLVAWSGIKRAGGAMHHGHYAAVNIHQHALSQIGGGTPSFLELQHALPSICLAIGKEATSYNSFEGVKFGEDVMELYFGNDLGNKICWNYMQLDQSVDGVASQTKHQ